MDVWHYAVTFYVTFNFHLQWPPYFKGSYLVASLKTWTVVYLHSKVGTQNRALIDYFLLVRASLFWIVHCQTFLALTLLSPLAGWRGGATVCGHHPEGASQVLPGSWGTWKPPVLPGIHIWSEGEDGTHFWLKFFNAAVVIVKKWQVSGSLASNISSREKAYGLWGRSLEIFASENDWKLVTSVFQAESV